MQSKPFITTFEQYTKIFVYTCPRDLTILSRRTSFPILRFMFYGHKKKQYVVRWDGVEKCNHSSKDCRCTLTVSFKPVKGVQIPDIVVPRRSGVVLLTLEEQFGVVLSKVLTSYALGDNDQLVPVSQGLSDSSLLLKFGFEYYSTPSNRLIRAPFDVKNMPRSRVVEEMPNLKKIVFDIDYSYLKHIGIDLRSIDVAPIPIGGVKSLRRLAIEKMSLYHTMFSLYGGNRAVVNTMEHLSAEKIVKLFSEFNSDVISRDGFNHIRKLSHRALTMLEDMLGSRQYYGKIPFRYNGDELIDYVSRGSSAAGVRPGRSRVIGTLGDIRIKEIPDGKKSDQFIHYAMEFDNFIHDLVENECKLEDYDVNEKFKTFCIMRFKDEFRYEWPPTVEGCAKLKLKCREFFIPNLLQQFLSKLLMTPRQLLERGDVIRIGQKWNYGEAQRFAEYMHAGSKRMRWHTGDVNKLDKHIRDWMLTLYVQFGSLFFSHQSVLSEKLCETLFVLLGERINVKVVNHIGSMWTLIKGMMYSGGYETSHGDSWCVLLCFCLYLVHVMDTSPSHADAIRKCVALGLIRFVVYGDDHVWVTPVELLLVLNEDLFSKFLLEFCGLEIRDARVIDNFYSTILKNGEIDRHGVVFLKRFFICQRIVKDKGFPVVYPFKPTHDSLIKLFCNKANMEITYPLQAIGQAYDTLGTNVVAYELIKRFYLYYCSVLKKTPSEIIDEALDSSDTVTIRKMLVRSGITLEELRRGFPLRHQLLALHKIDPKAGTNVVEYDNRDSLFKFDFIADLKVFGYVEDDQDI